MKRLSLGKFLKYTRTWCDACAKKKYNSEVVAKNIVSHVYDIKLEVYHCPFGGFHLRSKEKHNRFNL